MTALLNFVYLSYLVPANTRSLLNGKTYISIFPIKPEVDFKDYHHRRLVLLKANNNMCCYNFENIPISSRVIGVKPVFRGYFKFLGENGSRFFKPIYCTDHYYRT